MKFWVLTYQYDNYNGMVSTYPYKVLGLFKTRALAEESAAKRFNKALEWRKDQDNGGFEASVRRGGDWLRLERFAVQEAVSQPAESEAHE